MVKKRNIFKSNYIEIVKKAIPSFIVNEQQEKQEDLAYAVAGKTVLAIRELGNFLSANNLTIEQIIPYFIPSNKGTRITPQIFKNKILNRFGKTYEDFKDFKEFRHYLSGTVLPAITLNNLSSTFVASATNERYSTTPTTSSVEYDLVSSLGACYLLNTSGYAETSITLSSILADYLASGIWYGTGFSENEAIKCMFEHIWRNRETVESLKTYLPYYYHTATQIIDQDANANQIVYELDTTSNLPSSLRANILGIHGIAGAIGEQVSSLHRYFRGVSAVQDSDIVSNSYVHNKVFRTEPANYTTSVNINDELLYFVHRAKQLGYKVKITYSTLTQSSGLGTQAYYLSNIDYYADRITEVVASSFRQPSIITVGAYLINYPGYDLDAFALDNEPDIGWTNNVINGTPSGYAEWNVSALKRIQANLTASGIPIPRMGPGGFSNYKKEEWIDTYLSACAAQSFTPDFLGVHSYKRIGTMWSQFDIVGKIRSTADDWGLVGDDIDIEHDEYNINFFPVNNDNPRGIPPECDDHRAAICVASNDTEAIYNNVMTQVFFIHDKNFNNTNVQYSDDWSGKSPGLFLVSGAPKPAWWGKQMLSQAIDGSGIIQRTRSSETSALSWHTNCIGSINGDTMKLLLINGPMTSDNLNNNNEVSAYYQEAYLDYMAFANYDSSSYIGNFMSAVGQGVDVVLNGSISNSSSHKSWGQGAARSYMLELDAGSPFTDLATFVGRPISYDDIQWFVSAQHTWATANPGMGYESFSGNNPTWASSVAGAKVFFSGIRLGAEFNTQITINFDSGFVPMRIVSQYLLNKTHNRPMLLPQFNPNDSNSSYARVRRDYPQNANPDHQEARYDAIDLGIDPAGKNYGFGTAGQFQPLSDQEGVAQISISENKISAVLEPNSLLLLVLER